MLTSKDVKVQGLMGPAAPVDKKNAPVSDSPVGMGGTNAWKLASLVRVPARILLVVALKEVGAGGRRQEHNLQAL